MELTINGKTRQVDVPADMPVLWVLRDVLGNAIYAATGKRLRKLPLQPGLALAAR